jgi:hypothetical protein
MMQHLELLAFWALVFDIQHAKTQAQSVVWKFPAANDQVQANRQDTVLLDYTSTLSNNILLIWCGNEEDRSQYLGVTLL